MPAKFKLVFVIGFLLTCPCPIIGQDASATARRQEKPITPQVAEPTLRNLGKAKNLYIGTCVQQGFEVGKDVLAEHFSLLVAESHTKWDKIHPEQDRFDWDFTDRMVAFAKENKQEVKGHALVWHGAVPAYLSKLSSKELDKEVSTHINTVVGRYKLKEGETGRIRWDVVNEAIDDQGPGLRKTIFSENLGQDYIANCFRIAHKADPKAILIYNDYGCETLSPKSDRQYEMLKGLIAKKVPVHEVGLQMHVGFYRNGEVNIKELQLNVKRLAALGLKVNISEMDVPIGALPEGSVEERLKVQADRTKEILAACIDIKGFVGVTWWGFTDMCTWCSEPEKPLLFGRDLQGKPAFHAVLEVLAMKKDKRR